MHEIVIPALLTCNISDRTAEFTFHNDQCVVEQTSTFAPWNDSKILNKVGQTDIELPCRRVNTSDTVIPVDVLMVVPTTDRNLDVSRTKIRPKNVSCGDTGISKCVVTVFGLIARGESKCIDYGGV